MPRKYEQEIDEILRRMEPRASRVALRRRVGRRFANLANAVLGRLVVRPTPTGLLAAGLVFAFLGYILRGFVAGIGTPLVVVAIALFVSALVLSVSRSRRRPAAGWRGRRLDYRSSEPLIWASLARRFRAWRDSRGRRSRY